MCVTCRIFLLDEREDTGSARARVINRLRTARARPRASRSSGVLSVNLSPTHLLSFQRVLIVHAHAAPHRNFLTACIE